MSGNSWTSALQTAPIVSAFSGLGATAGSVGSGIATASAGQVGQLVLADLELVGVLQAVRVDPPAVHVGAVQRARVVEVPGAGPPHQQGMHAGDRHVVEEDLRV